MTPENMQELRDRNDALEKRVLELQAERDSYRRALHSFAKQLISEEQVRKWLAEDKIEGSLTDFINEVKQGDHQ